MITPFLSRKRIPTPLPLGSRKKNPGVSFMSLMVILTAPSSPNMVISGLAAPAFRVIRVRPEASTRLMDCAVMVDDFGAHPMAAQMMKSESTFMFAL